MAPAQCRAVDSMIPAAQVQAMATIKTAPTKANCATVPQIPSGRAKNRASPTAMAPAWAVETSPGAEQRTAGPNHQQADQDDPRSEERIRRRDQQHDGDAQPPHVLRGPPPRPRVTCTAVGRTTAPRTESVSAVLFSDDVMADLGVGAHGPRPGSRVPPEYIDYAIVSRCM